MPWPWTPVHRKFAHFNHLEDEDAKKAAHRVARGLRTEMVLDATAFGVFVGLVAGVFGGCIISTCMMGGGPLTWGVRSLLLIAALPAGVLGYLAAGWHYQRMMRLLLSDRLSTSAPNSAQPRCPHCSYPLAKLPKSRNETLTCPECGTQTPAQLSTDSPHTDGL